MSDSINPISSSQSSSEAQSISPSKITSDAVSQSGAVQSAGNSNSKVSNMADLRTKEPEFYQKMLESLATKICNQMRSHQERLKKAMREGRNI